MVRPFGLKDIAIVRQLQPRGVAFDLRRLLLHTSSPMSAALLGLVTHQRLGALTLVHEGDHSIGRRGFAQVMVRDGREEWDLSFLAPSLDFAPDASQLWQQLLRYLASMGIERGIMRIYARSSEDAEAEDILRQAGYSNVTREEVFVLAQQLAPAPLPRGMRRVESTDLWALEQLYRQVVPPQVQQAEGLVKRWCMPSRRTLLGDEPTEFIWSDKGAVIAYLGLCSSARGYWLEIIVRPGYRAELLPYIRYMLTLTELSHSRPIYCNVPDYAVGLGWLLRTLGFETYTRQVVMVLHTVARVPVRRPLVLPTLERSVDVTTTVSRLAADRPADERGHIA